MHQRDRVSDAVVRRLPGYYRHLRELEAQGVLRLSSRALGERMGLTASQIRQDMNCFGGFGQQGYGYYVPNLKRRIGEILGVDTPHHMVIVGAGNIGRAVASYPTFRKEGFVVDALFDVDPALIGQVLQGVEVWPAGELRNYLAEHAVDIVVIATPADSARAVLDTAAEAGVRAVWNFAPVDLPAPDKMELGNVHLSDSLMALSFRMHERALMDEGGSGWRR